MDDQDLDRLLRELPAVAPSAALRQAVIAAAPRERATADRGWWWRLGAGWAAAAAAGLVVGAVLVPSPDPAPTVLEQALSTDEAIWPGEFG
jgi:anti-sigma factor RsiW